MSFLSNYGNGIASGVIRELSPLEIDQVTGGTMTSDEILRLTMMYFDKLVDAWPDSNLMIKAIKDYFNFIFNYIEI